MELSKDLGLNCLLFLLGVLPGIFHAWYVILKKKFFILMWTFAAILLPPLVVGLNVGCTWELPFNILLTILGWLPGVFHAWYVLWTKKVARDLATTAIKTKYCC
eukprot:TRINITY_DN4143_c0_g1_i1.p2 TRINITY_DN4143_c0_g1~~TRINITY_DN4143_c0_g1_i1.p2  ORF type:complete len:104 (-),score=11.59 TRINITY_DN4143_c0_g1_i1:93-404(-)